MIQYQVLIPAYNAGSTIPRLLEDLSLCAQKPLKITIVNDGSEDNTVEACRGFNVQIISEKINKGKGIALKKGFEDFMINSHADYLLCLDADLQHPVTSIPDFLKVANETHSKFIIGSRKRSVKSMPLHRILSNTMTSFLLSVITGQKVKDSQCGFRLIHRDVLKQISLNESGYQLETEMLLKASEGGILLTFVSVPTIYKSEKSHMRPLRDTFLFIKLIIRYLLKRA
jgi:glycosyltransferase involved in cell wall biosynthesis